MHNLEKNPAKLTYLAKINFCLLGLATLIGWNAVVRLDYPADRIEIQVLDDSTDETVEKARRIVNQYKAQGINISHLHRTNRAGHKAGALEAGFATVLFPEPAGPSIATIFSFICIFTPVNFHPDHTQSARSRRCAKHPPHCADQLFLGLLRRVHPQRRPVVRGHPD